MTSKIYQNNRKNFQKLLPIADVILIVGNGLLSRSADTNYKFRQDSNLLYLSGIDEPGVSLLLDGVGQTQYLVIPTKTKIESIFDDTPSWQELVIGAGLDGFISEREALSIIKSSKNLHMNLPGKSFSHGLYANPNRTKWLRRLMRLGLKPKDARPALAKLRMIKQPYEIDSLRFAIKTTKDALSLVQKNINNYQTEQGIENDINAFFAKQGLCHGYQPIIASGRNAAILHHNASADALIANDSVLLFDVGAEFNGYSADISRTMVVGQNIKQQQIIDDVQECQAQLIKFLKPGVYFKDIQSYSEQLIGELIIKHKLGTNNDLKKIYPHAVGHFLGLDTHDIGDYGSALCENMVITIEPGIYCAEQSFGVRIEDDVLITKSAAIIL